MPFANIPRKVWLPLLNVAAAVALALPMVNFRDTAPSQASAAQVQNRPDAPDFSGGTDWLNTAKPINLPELKGRIVLLDFWTLC